MLEDRIRQLNDGRIPSQAEYVLYWSQMNRRVESNHALAYAVQLANELKLPVLVYEGLTCTYREANDRLHAFILEGVDDTRTRLRDLGIGYVFYIRRKRSDPNDVLYTLAACAAAVVTDDYPVFIAAGHNASVPAKLKIPYYVVDSSCVVPMRCFEKREYAAYTIRPKIHKLLPRYLAPASPLRVNRRYKSPPTRFHTEVHANAIPELVASCEIDHSVPPSLTFRGGSQSAERHLDYFLNNNLRRYDRDRNEPVAHATSDLSPYLHFGHISSLHVALRTTEYAKAHQVSASSFLEELIVRRELAFNFAAFAARPDSLSSLPEWARESLDRHAADTRPGEFTGDQMTQGQTVDPLWNATQKEMLLRGKIHGYYRMYWGKKVIEWSPSPADALKWMIRMHDRYALDGRDPNTYTNILWCFGLHDRPWFERPVFGKIRYMSFEGMKRKTNIDAYIREIRELERTRSDPFRIQ